MRLLELFNDYWSSRWNRDPQEPDLAKYPDSREGVAVPPPLDFECLKKEEEDPKRFVQRYVDQCLQVGLELTDAVKDPHAAHMGNRSTVTVETTQKQKLDVVIDEVKIAGLSPLQKDLRAVRHTIYKVPLRADVFMDGYNRLNYTDLVDKFTYFVEQVPEDTLEETAAISSTESDLAWCHVAYTADVLAPFLRERDFVTFDFVSRRHLLLCSRSCAHPAYPKNVSKTYRVPLLFYQRVLPDADDPENHCSIVQFQMSDIGGFIAPGFAIKGIVDFGVENIPKVVSAIVQAVSNDENGEETLGKGAPGYLDSPLEPSWRQNPKEMLPSL